MDETNNLDGLKEINIIKSKFTNKYENTKLIRIYFVKFSQNGKYVKILFIYVNYIFVYYKMDVRSLICQNLSRIFNFRDRLIHFFNTLSTILPLIIIFILGFINKHTIKTKRV